ncbi:MAG: hypothetical protein CMB31_01420 [Euryarchaeota archaeon]|nr:hypothetical protein [Euryarchaeota archaeon]
MKKDQLNLAVVLFVLMFIISGGNKVLNYKSPASEALRFSRKTGISMINSENIVFLAGFWELISAGIIIYSIYYDKTYLKTGVYSLMLFTLLATLIFYSTPFKYKPFLSNLSVFAGLYLMLKICEFK